MPSWTARWVIWGKDALISGNRAHREPVVAAVAARVRAAGIEAQVVSAVRARRALRGRPVEAVRAGTVEEGVAAPARCWQKDAIAVHLACELVTFDTI